jgi:outer membrane receptor protein involved in Fe transport
VFGSASQAFRAPNIDDLSTLGAFDYGIEVPPGALAPERSLAIEGGLKLHRRQVAGSAAVYRMGLRDLIDRERTTFHGSPVLDGQDVYRRANVGRAVVRGAEADLEWRASDTVTVFGFIAATHGQQTSAGVPMRRIPPANGLAGLRYRWRGGTWAESTMRIASSQHRLHPGDVSDHRIPPGGTAGWTVLSLSGGWPVARGVWLTGGVANVFNRAYRVHGSGVDGPGRHVWVSIRAAVN